MDYNSFDAEFKRVLTGTKNTLKALINKFGGNVSDELIDEYPELILAMGMGIDCGVWDSDPIQEHDNSRITHQNLSVDGNNSVPVDTSSTLEEHISNPNAHQNLFIDGNANAT